MLATNCHGCLADRVAIRFAIHCTFDSLARRRRKFFAFRPGFAFEIAIWRPVPCLFSALAAGINLAACAAKMTFAAKKCPI